MKTSTIEVMVAVHPGMVTPQVAAKMGASLDRISGGRCAINIVNGHWVEEFQLFSNGSWIADPETRYRRMEEYVLVMKGLWTDPGLPVHGRILPGRCARRPCRTRNKKSQFRTRGAFR